MADGLIVIRCMGWQTGKPCPQYGFYLKEYDPDAAGGNGKAVWTRHTEHAWAMPSKDMAIDVILAQPVEKPLLADGTPNRPITNYILSVEEIKHAMHDDFKRGR